jgi:hypothetical protein
MANPHIKINRLQQLDFAFVILLIIAKEMFFPLFRGDAFTGERIDVVINAR